MLRTVAWLLLLCAGGVFAQQPQLKIVVVEGEGAVNIIQQKTAVRAVVEVRDQNNLPVSGATVTFVIAEKAGTTLAAAQTVTVTTNAIGQAALTGVAPATTGGVQISVNAAFNGLTASTSITQSVVTTAATAGATGAGATGAAGAAAGGGLSTTTVIGIVGGAAAVGGGVAAAGGSRTTSGGTATAETVPRPPPTAGGTPTPSTPTPAPDANGPPCRWIVSPTTVHVPLSGGFIGINMLMEPEVCANPDWVVDLGSAASWITSDQRTGTRHGGVLFTIAPYTPTTSAPRRTGTVTVAGVIITFIQPPP